MRTVKLTNSRVVVFEYSESLNSYLAVTTCGMNDDDGLELLAEKLKVSEYVTVERHNVSHVGGIALDFKEVHVIITSDKCKTEKPRDM